MIQSFRLELKEKTILIIFLLSLHEEDDIKKARKSKKMTVRKC